MGVKTVQPYLPWISSLLVHVSVTYHGRTEEYNIYINKIFPGPPNPNFLIFFYQTNVWGKLGRTFNAFPFPAGQRFVNLSGSGVFPSWQSLSG